MGNIDLRDLELFVEVVDSGSITSGAERCGMSLSTASVRVSAIERRVGLRLLDRGRRGVVPTPAGAELVLRGRRLLDEARSLESGLAARARGLDSEITLAANSSAADALTEFLAAMLNRMPSTAVTLVELMSEDAVERVTTGEADLAVVSVLPVGGSFQTRALWADPMVVIGTAAAGRPRDAMSIDDVVREPIIGLVEGVPFQDRIDRELRRVGIEPAYRVRLPSLAAVCAVATTGVGRAIVPRGSALRYGASPRAVCALDEPWADRQARLVAKDFGALSETAANVAKLLVAYAAELDA